MRLLEEEGIVRAAMSGTPHDALVKATFGDVAVASSHLAPLLSPRLAAAIDWTTLRLEPGSFVDDALAQAHTDLLYSANLDGEPALLFVVLEHQARFDRWMPVRMFHYVASVWKRWLATNANAEHAPPVVAVVLHHSETGWRAAPELATVFAPRVREAFGDLLPTFRFVLDDISRSSLADLEQREGDALARLCLLALHAAANPERLRQAEPYLARVFRTVPGSQARHDAFVRLCQYLFRASDLAEAELAPLLVNIAGPEYASEVMTTAEQLQNLGRVEGRVEGLREALRRVFVVRDLRLSELGKARIDACSDPALLEEWLTRAITAANESDVFLR